MTRASGDTYRQLAATCRKRGLRLLICADDHRSPLRLSSLDVRKDGELRVRVMLDEHTLDSAALVALAGLKKAGIR